MKIKATLGSLAAGVFLGVVGDCHERPSSIKASMALLTGELAYTGSLSSELEDLSMALLTAELAYWIMEQ